MNETEELKAARELLEAHKDYRVLQRLAQPDSWNLPSAANAKMVRQGLFVDVETTGLDVTQDEVIELALLPFQYDPHTGEILAVDVDHALDELRDPGVPIPPESAEIHGITDAMVKGKQVDDARVGELAASADLVIAHNAAFDRPMVEKVWPAFEDVAWACSLSDIDWQAEGFSSGKLEFLLLQMGRFYDGHRALNDCLAGIYALSQTLPVSKVPAMKSLLASARVERSLIRAVDSPFDSKDALKQRGYRWDPGSADRPKSWWLLTQSPNEEVEWLRAEVYGYEANIPTTPIDARVRFSERIWNA
jgi:DNA polymerase-3 subunit epsilon